MAQLYPDFGYAPVDLDLYRTLSAQPEAQPAARPAGPHVGHSDNRCLTVRLDAAGPCGDVDADAGWIAQAAPARIAAAIQQAFTAAYEERDHHHG